MLCALESGMLLVSTVMLGVAVGFFVEEAATCLGYSPTNYLKKWRAARQVKRLGSVSA